MYSGTFFAQYVFNPNDLVICNQNVCTIAWGTVEDACCEAVGHLIEALPNKPTQYNYSQCMTFLDSNLTKPLSLCTLSIQTDNNTLTISLYEEKTLRLSLASGESYLYQLELPPSPTYHLPASTILEALNAGLYLLSATTPQKLENQLQQLEIFCNNILTPISG